MARSLARTTVPPPWRGLCAAVLALALLAACRSSAPRSPPEPTYVLNILVQPEGVWREDALSGRQGPFDEVRYEAEYVQLTVLLEGTARKELTATLATVLVTRQGELFLDGKRVAEGVREVTVAETVHDVSGSAADEAAAEKAGDILLGLLIGAVVIGAFALAAGNIHLGSPWGPD